MTCTGALLAGVAAWAVLVGPHRDAMVQVQPLYRDEGADRSHLDRSHGHVLLGVLLHHSRGIRAVNDEPGDTV